MTHRKKRCGKGHGQPPSWVGPPLLQNGQVRNIADKPLSGLSADVTSLGCRCQRLDPTQPLLELGTRQAQGGGLGCSRGEEAGALTG